MSTMASAATAPPPSSPASLQSPSSGAATDPLTASSSTNGKTDAKKSKQREEKIAEQKRKQKREKILRRAIPFLLTVPWFVGIIWAGLHPIVSVITGELKARGQYIDENGLDVHRHRVKKYPLQRIASLDDGTSAHADITGMCDAIQSLRLTGISPSVECLRHAATDTIEFDVVKILPPMGPMIESTEAVVLVMGDDQITRQQDHAHDKNKRGGWYERSDLNASILHLIKKLGNRKDCPWLTKTVFVVSPVAKVSTHTSSETSGNDSETSMHDEAIPLGSVVDAYMSSYLGGSDSQHVRPLPPDFTFPMIRSVLVINDVESTTAPKNNDRPTPTEVRILPQGIGGALPNLDLVFATFLSFQSRPAGDRIEHSQSLYHGDSEFRTHPFGGELELRVGQLLGPVGDMVGLKASSVGKYAKDLAGLLGFVAAMVIGPRQPHASALNHGIDALTIEVQLPGNKAASPPFIHPHYADLTRCVEHLLRSISNLHERLHHSIVQYTMPAPSKFVSHGEYIYPAILVSLPMVIRAATLAVRDLNRFQFLHVSTVLGGVCLASSIIGLWAVIANAGGVAENSTWISYVVFLISHLLVIPRKIIQPNDLDECRKSLRFVACLLGIYLHAPLFLANYSLGFPSSVFWSPLLATLVLTPSLRMHLLKYKVLMVVSRIVKCLFLLATSPPILLVPRIFSWYTPYVLGVYVPLHLLLTALWFA